MYTADMTKFVLNKIVYDNLLLYDIYKYIWEHNYITINRWPLVRDLKILFFFFTLTFWHFAIVLRNFVNCAWTTSKYKTDHYTFLFTWPKTSWRYAEGLQINSENRSIKSTEVKTIGHDERIIIVVIVTRSKGRLVEKRENVIRPIISWRVFAVDNTYNTWRGMVFLFVFFTIYLESWTSLNF